MPALFGPYPTELAQWPVLHVHLGFALVLAVARWRFRSIGVGVLLHAAWNLL